MVGANGGRRREGAGGEIPGPAAIATAALKALEDEHGK